MTLPVQTDLVVHCPTLLQLLEASGLRALHTISHYHSIRCAHAYSKVQVIEKLHTYLLTLPLPLFLSDTLTPDDLDLLSLLVSGQPLTPTRDGAPAPTPIMPHKLRAAREWADLRQMRPIQRLLALGLVYAAHLKDGQPTAIRGRGGPPKLLVPMEVADALKLLLSLPSINGKELPAPPKVA